MVAKAPHPKKGEADIAASVVSSGTLGEILGLSERRIRELRDERVIPDNGSGRYVLGTAISAYCSHIRPTQGGGSGGNSGDLTVERTRLAAAQADAVEIRNATARGEVLPVQEVKQVWSAFIVELRSRLLSVPSRVRQKIPAMTAAETGILDTEIRDAMEAISRGTD